MHRFLITSGAPGETVCLSQAEAQHARRVLRLKPGDSVQLIDGGGALFAAELVEVGVRVAARLIGLLPGARAPVGLTLYQGLPKFDKLEFLVQKAAELGAARIVPVKMSRSVVRLSAAEGAKKRERLDRIAREAMKQCGRADAVEVLEPLGFDEALQMLAREEVMLMPWESARGFHMRDAHAQCPGARSLGILVGPEGGISQAEADAAAAVGALAVTLGPRILRAETAAVAAMAVAMHLWGDL
jgi:16S rRNA (uracil1498-N3)-methyltransferase